MRHFSMYDKSYSVVLDGSVNIQQNDQVNSPFGYYNRSLNHWVRDNALGIKYVSRRAGNASKISFENVYAMHTKSVANREFEKRVLRDKVGRFLKGSNATNAQIVKQNIQTSSVRQGVGKAGSMIAKGSSESIVGIPLSTAIDLAVGPHTKKFAKETIGKNVSVGLVSTSLTVGAAAIMGVALPIPVVLGVGAGVAMGNDALRRNVPAVRNFENRIGEGVLDTYDTLKVGAARVAKNVEKTYSVVRSSAQILIDDAALSKAIRELQAAKEPLLEIQRINRSIVPEMNEDFGRITRLAYNIPTITHADIQEVVQSYRLSVDANVDHAAIAEVEHDIQAELRLLDDMIVAIRNVMAHSHQHDREWANKFSSM
ncbi:hypothetical protein LQZ24_01855 [Fructobacillus sp. M1-13]|uniref:Uncharacterized protein n=1 Tax=Fructobacillus papyriferae TaxID=2713171 RepID=A0ABS5QNR3_9LACO|nr:hypothetical protein [Fructobacillus papyriferae]MBS9334783.1 hypothetical protein [Fructobacillus papyriferae]MCD2158773.1 hypothetical protein [Fructobacillus papyriferae]